MSGFGNFGNLSNMNSMLSKASVVVLHQRVACELPIRWRDHIPSSSRIEMEQRSIDAKRGDAK